MELNIEVLIIVIHTFRASNFVYVHTVHSVRREDSYVNNGKEDLLTASSVLSALAILARAIRACDRIRDALELPTPHLQVTI